VWLTVNNKKKLIHWRRSFSFIYCHFAANKPWKSNHNQCVDQCQMVELVVVVCFHFLCNVTTTTGSCLLLIAGSLLTDQSNDQLRIKVQFKNEPNIEWNQMKIKNERKKAKRRRRWEVEWKAQPIDFLSFVRSFVCLFVCLFKWKQKETKRKSIEFDFQFNPSIHPFLSYQFNLIDKKSIGKQKREK